MLADGFVCVGPGSRQPVHLLCASEDGKWLAAANTDCGIHVYNLQTRKVTTSDPVKLISNRALAGAAH